MDGGSRQEAIHREIKQTVAAVTRVRRMMRTADTQNNAQEVNDEPVSDMSEDEREDHENCPEQDVERSLKGRPNDSLVQGQSDIPTDISTFQISRLDTDLEACEYQPPLTPDWNATSLYGLVTPVTFDDHSAGSQDIGVHPFQDFVPISTAYPDPNPATYPDFTEEIGHMVPRPSSHLSATATGCTPPLTRDPSHQSLADSSAYLQQTVKSKHRRTVSGIDESIRDFHLPPARHRGYITPSDGPEGSSRPGSEHRPTKSLRSLAHALSSPQTNNVHDNIRDAVSLIAGLSFDELKGESQDDPVDLASLRADTRAVLWQYTAMRSFSTEIERSPLQGKMARLLSLTSPRRSQGALLVEPWMIPLLENINQFSVLKRQSDSSVDDKSAEELRARALSIEHTIEYYLTADEFLHQEDDRDAHVNVSRNLHVHSLLIYLRVVAVGPFSESPKIRKSVRIAIASLASTIDSDLNSQQSFVWCFCIVGCLAGPEHHEALIEIYRGQTAGKGNARQFRLACALKVVQECWRLRANGIHACWRSARESLEQRGDISDIVCW